MNSTSKFPFVSFQGRKAAIDSVGHAFVGVGVQIEEGLRVYLHLFGLYPDGGTLTAVKSVFTSVSGKLDEKWTDLVWDTDLIVTVDEDQFKLVLKEFDIWSESGPDYSLLNNDGINCSALAAAVAGSINMKVPDGAGSTRPWKFIEALKALQ
ncbi:hypothetical protein UNDKW_5974 (plasmid) [Undibacterium sp. KW1]|nr:hypothetical protein UNDKW_5974 [Undibacterium sp. KW1]